MSDDKIIMVIEYPGKRIRLSQGALDVLGKQGYIKLLLDIVSDKLIIKPSKEYMGVYTVPASAQEFIECEEIVEEIWRLNRDMTYGQGYMVEGRLDSQDKELVFNLLKATKVQHEEIQQGQYYTTEIRKRQEYIDHALAVLSGENTDLRCLKIYDLKTEALTFLRDLSSWDWVFGEENGNILEVMNQGHKEQILEQYQAVKDGFQRIVEILTRYEIVSDEEREITWTG